MHRHTFLGGAALALLFALAFGLAAPAPAEAYLSYRLSSPLKNGNCLYDNDGDCLDDGREVSLGWAISPWYFYDEDEDCSGWENKFGQPSIHFDHQDFIQVRPSGERIRDWSPTDGKAKWVKVTYFLLYPHDCRGWPGGHQGDSESVRFYLYSYDLTTWYLSYAYYSHHGRSDYVSGTFLEEKAVALNTAWASVAADEDSHGSWPGRVTSSSDCAGDMDDFCYGTCDCFTGSWRSDFDNGLREFPSASRNIGGPSPELWNTATLSTGSGAAWTDLNIGHGTNREYWTPRSGSFSKFCGWECPSWYRTSGGDCSISVHDKSSCADGPLSSKVDGNEFWLGAKPFEPDPCPYCATAGAPESPSVRPLEAELFAPSRNGGSPPPNPDPLRAARGRDLTELAIARLLDEAGADPEARDDHQRWLARRAEDPIAAVVPMLLGVSPERQLETLRWMLTVPDDTRLAGAFDDLRGPAGRLRVNREMEARERVLDLVALLESRGLRAPAMPEGFTLAEVAPDAPEPNTEAD